jgi:hypothetical protein
VTDNFATFPFECPEVLCGIWRCGLTESLLMSNRAALQGVVTEARLAMKMLKMSNTNDPSDWSRARTALEPLLPPERGGAFGDTFLEDCFSDLVNGDFFLALLCLADTEAPTSPLPWIARIVRNTQLVAQLVCKRMLTLINRAQEVHVLLHVEKGVVGDVGVVTATPKVDGVCFNDRVWRSKV